MKILKAFGPVLIAGLLISLIFVSCGNSKKTAVPCPDFSKSRSYRSYYKETGKAPSVQFAQRETVRKRTHAYQVVENASGDQRGFLPHPDALQTVPERNRASEEFVYLRAKQSEILKVPDAVGIFPVTFSVASAPVDSLHPQNPARTLVNKDSIIVCDTLVFKAGNILLAKVIEIGVNEVKYRECENLSGPLISILKSDVFMIKYPNGTRDYFDQEAPVIRAETVDQKAPEQVIRKSEGLGTAGFIAGLLGLFIAGIPLGIFAIIAGSISIGKINRYPEKYKGKGLATASVIIGLIDVIGMLLLLSSM
ncbi:MAG: DUF4190 domain-containing protein [Bacteroidales bacterium]|nr:DUF4190 domain-containing protein [Bacteroidales bacterium]